MPVPEPPANHGPVQNADNEIQRLASLSATQYEQERKAGAKKLGMRASILDAVVKAARLPQDSKGQGRPFVMPSIEPWPSAVDGAELLNELRATIGRHIVLPSGTVETLALWAIHTHCFECFPISPRAAITSPEKGCGKTTTLDVLNHLVARPLQTSNATVSTIFRVIEIAKPTLLIDEADTFLNENDELRGILNSGHQRGGQVLRTVGDDYEPRQFSTFAPAAIAMIGRLPDTLNDRSVIVSLRRRKPSEKIASFRSDRAEHLAVLARKMARWAIDHERRLAESDPDMGELENRTADNWRPLFAIADACGEKWPARVREIANQTVKAAVEQSVKTQLLEDIRSIFSGETALLDRISSQDLVDKLTAMDGRPWAEWKSGRPLTQNTLARLLGPFEIISGTIRLPDGRTPKGYYRSAFDDAFSRYLPPQTATPPQPNNHGHCGALQDATRENDVALSETPQSNNHGYCGGVALSNPPVGESGDVDSDEAPPTAPEPVQDGNGHRHQNGDADYEATGACRWHPDKPAHAALAGMELCRECYERFDRAMNEPTPLPRRK